MRINLPLLCSVAILSSCSYVPREAHFNRGAPESLLDLSTEAVTVGLYSPESIDELVGWVNREQPSRAELQCDAQSLMCARAQDVLTQFSVPFETVASQSNQAVLMYERVVARDCEHRYIDNTINPYNLNYPTLGCANAANMVQMVGDKRQFISPNLLDFHDAERLQANYRGYATEGVGQQAGTSQSSNGAMQSLLNAVSTTSSR